MAKPRVLIPLDGSEFSRQIIKHVRKFLAPDAYDLVLMRVEEPQKGHTGHPAKIVSPDAFVSAYDSERDLEFTLHPVYESQEVEAAIGSLTDELRREAEPLEADGYQVSTVVHFGDPARSIVGYAAEAAIAMIAMTTHGRSGLRRLVAGSVASYVLSHSPVPVLLYRPFAENLAHSRHAAGNGHATM